MSTLIERIEEVMEATGWDVQQTPKVAGVSRSAVAQWLGQGSKIIHSSGRIDAAERLAAASDYNALWIARGEGEKKAPRGKVVAEWPFEGVSEEKVRRLSDVDRVRLEVAILAAAGVVGLDSKQDK